MNLALIILAAIILTSILLKKVSSKLGVPVLLFFLLFGIIIGWTDDVSIEFSEAAGNICTAALIFIMFYGGFGTNWKTAKPVALESGLLATVGVAITAAAVGLFCHYALNWEWIESLIMGSVISSTDAASVFSILRSRKLGLKNNTAPLLELESGSNDPCSYMLTVVMLSMLTGATSAGHVIWMIFAQMVFGAAGGFIIAKVATWVLSHRTLPKGFDVLFILATALMGYAIPSAIGGNGYLSVYIIGIILGNYEFRGRKELINFFDGITTFMEILIFFLLGYICYPENLPKVIVPALAIFAFITLVARPLAVKTILSGFKKYKPRQIALISFVGLRGAASIVFAILTLPHGELLNHDIFGIVFCIVLVSIALQGSLVPGVARMLKMTDEGSDVMKTFSDFSDSSELTFGRISVGKGSKWADKMVKDLELPEDMRLLMVLRGDERIITKGDTLLIAGDEVVICSRTYENSSSTDITEHPLSKNSRWAGKRVKDYPAGSNSFLVMIRRGNEQIIPDGNTVLMHGDILVILNT